MTTYAELKKEGFIGALAGAARAALPAVGRWAMKEAPNIALQTGMQFGLNAALAPSEQPATQPAAGGPAPSGPPAPHGGQPHATGAGAGPFSGPPLPRYNKMGSDARVLALVAGVERFCKEAGFDADDTAAMFELLEKDAFFDTVGSVVGGVAGGAAGGIAGLGAASIPVGIAGSVAGGVAGEYAGGKLDKMFGIGQKPALPKPPVPPKPPAAPAHGLMPNQYKMASKVRSKIAANVSDWLSFSDMSAPDALGSAGAGGVTSNGNAMTGTAARPAAGGGIGGARIGSEGMQLSGPDGSTATYNADGSITNADGSRTRGGRQVIEPNGGRDAAQTMGKAFKPEWQRGPVDSVVDAGKDTYNYAKSFLPGSDSYVSQADKRQAWNANVSARNQDGSIQSKGQYTNEQNDLLGAANKRNFEDRAEALQRSQGLSPEQAANRAGGQSGNYSYRDQYLKAKGVANDSAKPAAPPSTPPPTQPGPQKGMGYAPTAPKPPSAPSGNIQPTPGSLNVQTPGGGPSPLSKSPIPPIRK